MRVGLIGMGSIGQRHMNNLVSMDKEIELFAYDRDEDRLGMMPDSYPIFQSSHKILALWEWNPDAVIICVPPDWHYRIANQALGLGMHVLCEKPLATNYTDAKILTDEARARNKVLAVGYQLRFLLSGFRERAEGSDIEFVCAQDMSAWPSQYKKDILEEYSHEISSAVFCKGPVEAVTATEHDGKWDIQLRHLQSYSKITLASTSKEFIRHATASNKQWQNTRWEFDSTLNDHAYKDELGAFLAACNGAPWDWRLCSAAEGAHVCAVIEACRESTKLCSVVRL